MDHSRAGGRPPCPTNADIDAVLAEFGGDAREVIRALLHDLTVMACDYEAAVSRGYVRGAVPARKKRS